MIYIYYIYLRVHVCIDIVYLIIHTYTHTHRQWDFNLLKLYHLKFQNKDIFCFPPPYQHSLSLVLSVITNNNFAILPDLSCWRSQRVTTEVLLPLELSWSRTNFCRMLSSMTNVSLLLLSQLLRRLLVRPSCGWRPYRTSCLLVSCDLWNRKNR